MIAYKTQMQTTTTLCSSSSSSSSSCSDSLLMFDSLVLAGLAQPGRVIEEPCRDCLQNTDTDNYYTLW